MIATVQIGHREFRIDLSLPQDISLSLRGDQKNPEAWYLDPPRITPVKEAGWTGQVSAGGAVNFNNINFNPHAHTTHTECVGHITPEFHGLNDSLKTFFFHAKLISLTPERSGADELLTEKMLSEALGVPNVQALVIRTLPNTIAKRSRHYSHTNWPYLTESAARFLRESGIDHLLIDLPSIDKEKDDGKLLAHKAFWNYPKKARLDATITELIYVPTKIPDGEYLLNLCPPSIENDAAPSRPVLYSLSEKPRNFRPKG